MSVPVLEPVSVKNQLIPIAPEFKLLIGPKDEILSIGYVPSNGGAAAAFFIKMDPSAANKVDRTFRLYPSGIALGEDLERLKYLGSFIAQHPVMGQQNFHCFELLKKEVIQ